MRIIAGRRKGLIIKSIEGESTRPTKDMVREALFSILTNRISESKVLDLFAGSGAIGIEAISRGSKVAFFSDSNPKCVKIIKENIAKAGFENESEVYCLDYKAVLNMLNCNQEKFDIIYIDPPYHKGLGIDALSLISNYNILQEDGIIILEADEDEEIPLEVGEFERYNNKRYGRNVLNFFRRKG